MIKLSFIYLFHNLLSWPFDLSLFLRADPSIAQSSTPRVLLQLG